MVELVPALVEASVVRGQAVQVAVAVGVCALEAVLAIKCKKCLRVRQTCMGLHKSKYARRERAKILPTFIQTYGKKLLKKDKCEMGAYTTAVSCTVLSIDYCRFLSKNIVYCADVQ